MSTWLFAMIFCSSLWGLPTHFLPSSSYTNTLSCTPRVSPRQTWYPSESVWSKLRLMGICCYGSYIEPWYPFASWWDTERCIRVRSIWPTWEWGSEDESWRFLLYPDISYRTANRSLFTYPEKFSISTSAGWIFHKIVFRDDASMNTIQSTTGLYDFLTDCHKILVLFSFRTILKLVIPLLFLLCRSES